EAPAPRGLPRVALIIDDIGYDRPLAEKLIALEAPLTFSVLPHSPHQKALARLAHERGREVLLHLPMEPLEYPAIQPGPGALLSSMTPDQLLEEVERNLQAVPYVRGVNNHMGSRLTADPDRMNQVFSVLRRHGLFFVDSRTTEESACSSAARLFQVPFARRDVFLDHRPEPEFIRRQMAALVRQARRQGEAIAIAHPHPATYEVLREELPRLKAEIEFVPASRLARLIE
ncbi:MAG: divergent polysaccharide deacetylase family protein, partial [Desulfobacterales bacterium]